MSQSAVWDDDVDAGKGSDFRQIVDRGRSLENQHQMSNHVHTYEDPFEKLLHASHSRYMTHNDLEKQWTRPVF